MQSHNFDKHEIQCRMHWYYLLFLPLGEQEQLEQPLALINNVRTITTHQQTHYSYVMICVKTCTFKKQVCLGFKLQHKDYNSNDYNNND